MPPSREFDVQLVPAVKSKLEQELGVGFHDVRFRRGRQARLHGTIEGNRITMELGLDLFQHSSLRAVTREVVETLLHEYRHAWQHVNWPLGEILEDQERPYRAREMERDAEDFAHRNTTRWMKAGLIRLRPRATRSRLSRLSAAERRAA